MGDGRVVLCLIPGALMAQPTLKLKTSTDLCPVDLGVFSSRAELVVDEEMCNVTWKRPRGKSTFKDWRHNLFFFGHLWLYIYTVRSIINNKIFRF